MSETTEWDVDAAVPAAGYSDPAVSADTRSAWRRMRLWFVAHAIDDLYQGLIPASVPYFVLDRHLSYVAASGLTLAATLGSSIPQPLIGLAVDRRPLRWLAGAGVALAGIGVGLSGLFHAYAVVWTLILLSGLGIAAFHPAAGKAARLEAGESALSMSVFAAGGSVGFFLAPVLATPALIAWGLGATALFIPPAVLIGFVLLRHLERGKATAGDGGAEHAGTDRWRPFSVLVAVEATRSVLYFGVNTFIELYWIRHLGAGRTLAGIALACFLGGSVLGTLLGGRIADRLGSVRTVQIGGLAGIPTLLALRLVPGMYVPLLFAVLAGAAVNIPFAVLVKLGQDYLPTRPGTAAGVTLGLGVSIGGLAAPLLGLAADRLGPQGVLALMCAVPPVAVLLGLALPEPGPRNAPTGGAIAATS